MLHELDREDAWFIVEEIGCLDLGSMEAWKWWFKNVWRRLEASKWFEEICVRDSPVYPIQQRITLFALRWIAEDFVNVIDGSSDPDWDEWISMLGLDADQLLGVVRGHSQWPAIEAEIREDLGEEDVYADTEEGDSERQWHEDEVMSQLLPQAACFAAAMQRRRLFLWLRRIFVRSEHLFQSLWGVAHCGGAGQFGEVFNDHDDEYTPTDIGWPFAQESDPDLPPKLAAKLNRIAMAVFTDSIGFDQETAERLKAWEWVEGGCRIRSQGYPQYAGPWID